MRTTLFCLSQRSPILGFVAFSALLLSSCVSDRFLPKHTYDRMIRAYSTDSATGGISKSVMEGQEVRFEAVRKAEADGQIESADDHLWSAAIIVTSDDVADLELAHELAEEANRLGEARGLMVAAEAIDLLAIKHGMPQKYGTQLRFEPVLGIWKLHNVDPRTTDDERVRMGLPTMAEIQLELERRNSSPMTERMRERLQVGWSQAQS